MGLTRLQASTITDSDFKTSCKVATQTNITNLTTGAPNTVDGQSLSVGDRVLVRAQGNAAENGIYTVVSVGTGSNGRWARAVDFKDNVSISSGSITFVENGTNANNFYYLAGGIGTITVGSTNLTFRNFTAGAPGSDTQVLFNNNGEFGASSSLTWNGSNLAITGNILANGFYFSNGSPFTVDSTQILNGNSNVKVAANGNVGISVTGNSNVVVITDTGANINGYANITGDATVGGNLTVTGDFTVNGNTTTLNTSTLDVEDLNITLAKGAASSSAANGAGITIDGASATFVYNSITNTWVSSHGANITGTANVTGNVNVGNLGATTLVATDLTGNLTTAAQPNITSVGTLSSLSVTGNTSAGNLNTAGKVVGSVLESNVTTGTAPLTVISTTQVANLNAATAGHAVTANTVVDASQPNITSVGTLGSLSVTGNANVGNLGATTVVATDLTGNLTTAAQPNITSVGTLSSLIVSGNANVGNILAGGFYFANGSPFTIDTTQILNGNSNVVVSANSNVTVSVAGNASVVTVTGTGANIAGYANVTGNANVGNLGAATVVATDLTGNLTTAAQPNITSVGTLSSVAVSGNANVGNLNSSGKVVASTLESNVTTGTAPITVISTTQVANLNAATAGHSVTANTVVDASQPNITSVGTLSSLSVTGNANTGNLGTGTVIATTANLTTINSGLLQNGNSNIAITANGNLTLTATSNATLIITATGANIAGTANITGNVNVGNIGGTTAVFTDLTGNLTTAAQPNITSVGTLTSLTVGNILPSANITYDIGSSTARFRDLYLSGTKISLGGANISATAGGDITFTGNANVGNLNTTGDIQIGGNDIRSSTGNIAISLSDKDVTVVGNLAVQGLTTTIGSQNYSVQDSIIDLHTFPNLAPLTADDGRDIGIRMHYFKSTTDKHAFLGWANDTGALEYYSDATETNGVVSGQYGTVKANLYLSEVATGTAPLAVKSTTQVANLNAQYAGNAVTANTVIDASQPNITSIGTLTSLSVTGNANIGNLGTAQVLATANITTPQFISNVATGTAPIVVTSTTQVANLNVALAGNAVNLDNGTSNVVVTNNGNVTVGVAGNAAILTVTGTGANISGTANITGNANVGNIGATFANITSNLAAGNLRTTGLMLSETIIANANANVGNLGTTGNITAGYFLGNGSQLTGVVATSATTATTAATVTTAAQPNITSVGTLTSLSVTGNANTGNLGTGTIIATAANLTTINSGLVQNGNSNVTITANSNVSIFINGNATARAVFTSTGANIAGTANVTGNLSVGGILTDNYYYANGTVISFGGVNFTASTTAPTSPTVGDQWYDTSSDVLFLRVNDGTSDLWIDATSTPRVPAITASSTAPTSAEAGDMWYDTSTDIFYVRVNDGVDAFWLDISSHPNSFSTLAVTGNANVGNLNLTGNIVDSGALTISTGSNGNINLSPNGTGIIVASSNISGPAFVNGNSGVAITANANVTINVTAANSYTFATGSFAPNGNGAQQLGLTGARWSNIWGLASSAQYADLAEKYLADESYAPATVVIFGGKAEITVTTQSHDSRVAGVISTEPAYLMNDNEHQGNLWLPVALTGRVPCRVQGPVRKGDVLVTSSTAGVAEKLDKTIYEPGCVIGKSLENHMENTIKTIEVVVGRF